jgi:predicted nucleotidyltransferase
LVKISTELKEIISRYSVALGKLGFHISAVFLYGSYVLGTNHEGSDIDLIVISPDFIGLSMRERLEVLGIAAGRIMEPIEAFGFTPEEISQQKLDAFYADILENEAIPV